MRGIGVNSVAAIRRGRIVRLIRVRVAAVMMPRACLPGVPMVTRHVR